MSAKYCKQCGIPLLVGEALCDSCKELNDKPDPLSKRIHLGKIPFRDMKSMNEDDRITLIVEQLRSHPSGVISLMLDAGGIHQGKGDRYLEKIRKLLPSVVVVSRINGPVPETETLRLKAA